MSPALVVAGTALKEPPLFPVGLRRVSTAVNSNPTKSASTSRRQTPQTQFTEPCNEALL
jgi:hypothetical protein